MGTKIELKKKLSFLTVDSDVFLRDLIVNFRKDYQIQIFNKGDQDEFNTLLHDSDVCWFEWCGPLVAEATSSQKMCKYVCRLHSYEMFTDMPSKVNWSKMDKMIFVSPTIMDYACKKFKIPKEICTVIPNGVDVKKFDIPKEKKFNKKVVFVGYINHKKGPELLLQAFKKIWDYDNEFEFYIAGQHQEERCYLYFETMKPFLPFEVHLEGWQKDMSAYFADKDFVISTSIFESFQYALAEGMSQGVCPLIHTWLGSDLIYPSKYLWSFVDDCVEVVKSFAELTEEEKKEERRLLRQYIVDNYSLDKQLKKTREMLEML